MNLRHSIHYAEDINGERLVEGDKVRVTQAYLERFRGTLSKLGEELTIVEMYKIPSVYPGEMLGELRYCNGRGVKWNSLLNLYEKVK